MPGTEENTTTTTTQEPTTFTPPATQADLDRIITDRLTRERAKFEGFDAYKSKAEQFDALKGTVLKAPDAPDDKLTERLLEFETRVTAAEKIATESSVELTRLQVATDKGITKDDLVLLTATTKEALEAQADRIVRLNAGSGRVPGQGGRDTGPLTGTVASGRELFESRKNPKP